MLNNGGDVIKWVEILVHALTPLAIFGLGFFAKAVADRYERERALFEAQAQWRLEIFREMSVYLNDIYCFYTYVGEWRCITPDAATKSKREADRLVATNYFLWSASFLDAWKAFSETAFEANRGRGKSFRFRANVDMHRESPHWLPEWEERFVPAGQRVRRSAFIRSYQAMIDAAVRDLGIV